MSLSGIDVRVLVHELSKEIVGSWINSKMVKTIAKTFKVTENDISTGGIKDAFAETRQLFSVYQPRRVPSDPFQPHVNIEFSNFRYRHTWPNFSNSGFFRSWFRGCKKRLC